LTGVKQQVLAFKSASAWSYTAAVNRPTPQCARIPRPLMALLSKLLVIAQGRPDPRVVGVFSAARLSHNTP